MEQISHQALKSLSMCHHVHFLKLPGELHHLHNVDNHIRRHNYMLNIRNVQYLHYLLFLEICKLLAF